jgi:hypothetical protein
MHRRCCPRMRGDRCVTRCLVHPEEEGATDLRERRSESPKSPAAAVNIRFGMVVRPDAMHMKNRTVQCKTILMALRYFRPLRCHGAYPFHFVRLLHCLACLGNRNRLGIKCERRSSLQTWRQMPDGLPFSASRVAGEISALGRSRIRPCGLTAASRPDPRFARLASTSLPGRSDGLRSGLFCPEAKTIPPLHPSPASGRGVCLLVSGKPTVKHTHT